MMRKGKRGPNAKEKHFQGWLKLQPCVITGRVGVDVHHMYGSTFKHNKQHIGHIACISLCKDMHQGMDGIHTIGKRRWCDINGPQYKFFMIQYERYLSEGHEPFSDVEIQAIQDWGR